MSSPESDKFVRVTISIPPELLPTIDAAAEELNETRSNFLVQAALMRVGLQPMTLTPADLQALYQLLKENK